MNRSNNDRTQQIMNDAPANQHACDIELGHKGKAWPASQANAIDNQSTAVRPKATIGRKKQGSLEDDALWEATIKAKILSDEGLYLRILRYEVGVYQI